MYYMIIIYYIVYNKESLFISGECCHLVSPKIAMPMKKQWGSKRLVTPAGCTAEMHSSGGAVTPLDSYWLCTAPIWP